MTPRQLANSLTNLHTDFLDSEMVVMFVDKNGGIDYQLLSFVGMIVKNDVSYAVLGTEPAAREMSKKGIAKFAHNGKTLTDEDLDNMKNTDET